MSFIFTNVGPIIWCNISQKIKIVVAYVKKLCLKVPLNLSKFHWHSSICKHFFSFKISIFSPIYLCGCEDALFLRHIIFCGACNGSTEGMWANIVNIIIKKCHLTHFNCHIKVTDDRRSPTLIWLKSMQQCQYFRTHIQ